MTTENGKTASNMRMCWKSYVADNDGNMQET